MSVPHHPSPLLQVYLLPVVDRDAELQVVASLGLPLLVLVEELDGVAHLHQELVVAGVRVQAEQHGARALVGSQGGHDAKVFGKLVCFSARETERAQGTLATATEAVGCNDSDKIKERGPEAQNKEIKEKCSCSDCAEHQKPQLTL